MMIKNLAVIATLHATLLNAASGPVVIGTASARGDIRVDHLTVKGNATVFDGSVIETGLTSADLRLGKGTHLSLSVNSRGRLYRDHLTLESGTSEVRSMGGFQVDADGLRVSPDSAGSSAVVSVKPNKTVEVTTLAGSFDVTNSAGTALGRVLPGHPLSFTPQSGGSAAASQSFTGTGILSQDADGKFYLTANGAKYQVTGNNLAKLVGKKVTITGTTVAGQAAAGGAVLVVSVTTAGVAGAVLASGVVIGGIVVGAGVGTALTVGGLALAGTFTSIP
jgi:hypothetical protein